MRSVRGAPDDLPGFWASGALRGGLGVCELCFQGATPEQIADCELHADTDQLEAKLLKRLERATGKHGSTIVAFALGR